MKAIGILPTVIYELDIPHEIYSHLVELCNTINWSKSSKYTGGAVSVDMLESSYPTWRWWVEEQLNIINKNTLKDITHSPMVYVQWCYIFNRRCRQYGIH